MSGSRISLITLLLALVVSNAMWAYHVKSPRAPAAAPEYGCSYSEHRQELDREVVAPLTAAIAASAMPNATRESVVAAASGAGLNDSRYHFCMQESDHIVRRVGLRFNGEGVLDGASTKPCPH